MQRSQGLRRAGLARRSHDPQVGIEGRGEAMNRDDIDEVRFEDLDEEGDDTDMATDPMEASDGARPYVPPTDPPVVAGGRQGVRMGVGFATTSEDDLDEGVGVGNNSGGTARRPDDELTARVKRLLRTDAATSMLHLEVETVDGVVYLRGEVDTLDDGDLAAEVAARVRDVEDVVDETTMRD